jgi:GAF domain-containing protein
VAIDREALDASLGQLARSAPEQVSVERLLQEVVETARQLFGHHGAGVMFVDREQELRSVAASDAAGLLLERLQAELGEGPCVDAFVYGKTVFADDLAADDRYPNLGPKCAAYGLCSLVGSPVHLAGQAVGSFNLYEREPYAWTDDELSGVQAFTQVLESLLTAQLAAERNDELAGQLQYALDYRVVIERGIGYLMARDGLDAVAAFNQLRTAARSSRRKVTEVAAQLLEGRGLPVR